MPLRLLCAVALRIRVPSASWGQEAAQRGEHRVRSHPYGSCPLHQEMVSGCVIPHREGYRRRCCADWAQKGLFFVEPLNALILRKVIYCFRNKLVMKLFMWFRALIFVFLVALVVWITRFLRSASVLEMLISVVYISLRGAWREAEGRQKGGRREAEGKQKGERAVRWQLEDGERVGCGGRQKG